MVIIRPNLCRADENDRSIIADGNVIEECKVEIEGFDYQIQYSSDGKPSAVMYITPFMRYNLIYYGNLIFFKND